MKLIIILIAVFFSHLFFFLWLFQDEPEPSVLSDHSQQEEQLDDQQEKEKTDSLRSGMDYGDFSHPELNLPENVEELADNCRTGVLIDWTEKRILWEKKAEQPVPIASITKLMTVLLMMETIEREPDISLETQVDVSKAAASVGGRQVWLDPRESFTLDTLLKIIMMHSANDAAFLVAEFLSGEEIDRFIARMNERAEDFGMSNTKFVNPHGLDTNENERYNQSSAYDLAWLASILLDYPRVVHWSSTWTSSIRDDDSRFDTFDLVNNNRLVHTYPGVNGMKTGYTEMAGFCLVATCERDNRTLISVLTGCPSADQRNELTAALLDWGYAQ